MKFGRSRRPENNICWLAPSNIFQKKGGILSVGLCGLTSMISVILDIKVFVFCAEPVLQFEEGVYQVNDDS